MRHADKPFATESNINGVSLAKIMQSVYSLCMEKWIERRINNKSNSNF
jgi:hypothetical protein